jgi:hypothetical protein
MRHDPDTFCPDSSQTEWEPDGQAFASPERAIVWGALGVVLLALAGAVFSLLLQ